MTTFDEMIAEQRAKWLSMKHVGDARPVVRAFVRKGHLERKYRRLPDNEVYAYVPGLLTPNDVWFGEWVADTDYVEVPNVKEAKGDQDYSQNGVEQLTLSIDNTAMVQEEGPMGALFHLIQRGFFSPQRGNPSERGERAGAKNQWFDIWKDKATQIIVIGGYGEAIFPLHVGLIDKTNVTSGPDTIVANIRNMGQFLTDQSVFMDAKNLWVRDPITFADRVSVQEGPNIANTAQAKSAKTGHPASLAVDGNSTSAWVSGGGDAMQWIEFPLAAAHLIKFELFPGYTNMEMYVSVFASNNNVPGGGQARLGGEVVGAGWVSVGKGSVPGTTIPWTNHVEGVRETFTTFPIVYSGQKVITGDDTRVRLWFTNLQESPTDDGHGTTHRAAIRECRIRDASVPEAAKKSHWILVDDVSDIIKVVLQWAGFDEWEVEKTGVRLADKVVFDRTKKLIDLINYVKEQVSYIFYVRPPDTFDTTNLHKGNKKNLSMGVAVFRQPSSLQEDPRDEVESVRDDNLLTGVEAEFDSGQLPDSIRVRGKAVSDKIAINDPQHIHPLGADRTKRFQASYRPVWARRSSQGQAHLRRPELHYDYTLDENYLCQVACLLIAYQAALSSAKGEIEIPMWPLIHLDHQTLLFDRATGSSTRLWNIQRSWNYVSGENAEFKMNLGGSFIDTNDVAQTRDELVELLNERGRMPHPIARGPWTDPHKF
jgi:hypothetical protein